MGRITLSPIGVSLAVCLILAMEYEREGFWASSEPQLWRASCVCSHFFQEKAVSWEGDVGQEWEQPSQPQPEAKHPA